MQLYPGLQECLNYIRGGDTLIVWESDRLGRSTVDLLNIIDDLRKRNVGFKSLTEDLFDTTSSNGRLVFGIVILTRECLILPGRLKKKFLKRLNI